MPKICTGSSDEGTKSSSMAPSSTVPTTLSASPSGTAKKTTPSVDRDESKEVAMASDQHHQTAFSPTRTPSLGGGFSSDSSSSRGSEASSTWIDIELGDQEDLNNTVVGPPSEEELKHWVGEEPEASDGEEEEEGASSSGGRCHFMAAQVALFRMIR